MLRLSGEIEGWREIIEAVFQFFCWMAPIQAPYSINSRVDT